MHKQHIAEGPNTTLWTQAGGEAVVRPLVAQLVDRMRADVMIGFFFRKTQPARLAELEYQHASSHLGGPVAYTGRPIAQAHARFPIASGHFARRRTILRECLTQFEVPVNVAEAWLAAQDALRAAVVHSGPACPDDGAPR